MTGKRGIFPSGLLVLVFLLPLLSGCSTAAGRAAQAAKVWAALETPGCDLPCWRGLTPGQATLEEVGAVLGASDFVAGYNCFDLPDAEEEARAGGFCYWESRAGYPLWGGVFQFGREGDEPLMTNLLYLRVPISFEESVAHFGEPDTVWALQHELRSDECRCAARNPRQSEDGGPDFDLIYLRQGMILSAFAEQPEQWPCLCRLMWVDAITLGPPTDGLDLDGWWREMFGYGADEEEGDFFDFPGWGKPLQ